MSGGSTALTDGGPWVAYRSSQRRRSASAIGATLDRLTRSYTGPVSREAVSPADERAGAARRSDRRPAQTIRKVLDAGLEELRESSYANLTMRAVATRAGVSPASAYTYFPSKSALVAAVYLRFLRDLPLHTDVNDATQTRVSATLRDMALVVADEPELTTACGASLMADDPAVKPLRGADRRRGIEADRRRAGSRVAARGEVRPADDIRRGAHDGPVRQLSRDRRTARRGRQPHPGRICDVRPSGSIEFSSMGCPCVERPDRRYDPAVAMTGYWLAVR